MFEGQLDMSFESGASCLSRRQRRLSRAQWWFQRMRQVVERAIEWQELPPARPEQMWLPATPRDNATPAHPEDTNEQQICE